MTRILRLLLVVILCLSMLASCQFGKETTTTKNPHYVTPRIICDTLEEYDAFLEENYFTKQFITYESLSDLGKFVAFYPDAKRDKESYVDRDPYPVEYARECYYYCLKGQKEGVYLFVDVYNESFTRPSFYYSEYVYLKEKPESFLTSELDAIEYNGIYYLYGEKIAEDSAQRKLDRIFLFENNNSIEIGAEPEYGGSVTLYDYLYEGIVEDDNLLSCLLNGNPDNVDLCVKYLNAPAINIEKRDNGEIYVNDTLIEEGMEFFAFIDVLDRYSKYYHDWPNHFLVWSDTFDKDKLYLNVVTGEDGIPTIDFAFVSNNTDLHTDVEIDANGKCSINGAEIGNKTTYDEIVEMIGIEGLNTYVGVNDKFHNMYIWEFSDFEIFVMYFDDDGNSCFDVLNKEESGVFIFF